MIKTQDELSCKKKRPFGTKRKGWFNSEMIVVKCSGKGKWSKKRRGSGATLMQEMRGNTGRVGHQRE